MTPERIKDIFVFFVGLMTFFKFRILGTFYGNEIVIYVSYFFINWTIFKENPKVCLLIKMAFVWLAGVIIADLWNDTNTTDALKGAFSVIFMIMLIPFIYWALYDNQKRLLYYIIGAGIATIIRYHTGGALELVEDSLEDLLIWRVYFYYLGAIAIAGLLYLRGYKKISYITIVSYGFWALFFASRNVFLAQTLAVSVLLFIDTNKNNDLLERASSFRRSIVQLIVVLCIGLFAVDVIYESLAADGTLGERVYEKYMMQKHAKGGLASGRGDSFVSTVLIIENPIVGYGSYAIDHQGLAIKLAHEYDLEYEGDTFDQLPGHSHILGAWVYHGILGFVFWAFVLFYLLKVLLSGNLLKEPSLLGIRIYLFMYNMWNILFSPYQDRIMVPLLLISFMILDHETEEYYPEEYELIENRNG